MTSVVAPVYGEDTQSMSVTAMDTTTLPPDLLAGYTPEILPSQTFQAALNSIYMVKTEQQDPVTTDMQVIPEETSSLYMSMPMPVDTLDSAAMQSLSPPYATEIVPEAGFSSLASNSAMAMELSPLTLSTPSPPALSNGSILGTIQAATSTYSVATSSSLDAALIPTMSLASPTHSTHSVSPVSIPSTYSVPSSQSPPAHHMLSMPESEEAEAKRGVMNILDSMVVALSAAKEAVERADSKESVRDLMRSSMQALSRMAANLSINQNQDPSLATLLESQMVEMPELNGGYSNHTPANLETTTHSLVSDQSRKRTASEMDEARSLTALKREPAEDSPLALPMADPLGLSPPTMFPATSAIPLSAQASQSRPVSRPPTPQSTFASFAPMSPFALPSTTSMVLGAPVVPLATSPISTNPSFSSVRPGWPDQTVGPSRHHHSLSAGSLIHPMQMMHIPMPPIPHVPGLASGPTTPITANPPTLSRTSRSGSLSSAYDSPFTFNRDTPTEPPLKKAALGTRSARNSTVGSNWYFGNDESSPSNTSEEPGTTRNTPSDDEDDDSGTDSEDNEHRPTNGHHSSFSDSTPVASSSTSSDIPQEYRTEVDRIFFEYLNKICSNLDAKDSKGDHIHQTLMAKKMQRLDESPDFRPFKFRIQAFTSAFLEELARQGYPEDKIPMKKVRNYLWHQPHILRFNEDGKKAKSKGNHIWNVEARKLGEARWEFRPFHRKLAGSPPPVAYCGLKWSWTPRIWDPQASFANVPVSYTSPNLPSWLSWKDDMLSGIPPSDAESCSITVNAKYTLDGVEGQLSRVVHIAIAPVSSVENNAYPRSRRPSISEPPRRSTSDSALSQAVQRAKARPVAAPTPIPGESSSTRVARVFQNVAQRVTVEAGITTHEIGQLPAFVKSKQVVGKTVEAMGKELAGEGHMETKRLAIAAQQVVIQAAANVIADRNVSIGRAPVVPNKSTAVQRVSVNELSDATHDAIVQAVKTNGPASTEVDIIVSAASILKAQAPVADPHPPSTATTRPPTHPALFLQNLSPLPEFP